MSAHRAALTGILLCALVATGCTDGGADPAPSPTAPSTSAPTPTATLARCEDEVAVDDGWASEADGIVEEGTPTLDGFELRPLEDAESRRAIIRRALPAWECGTGIIDARPGIHLLVDDAVISGFVLVLPVPAAVPPARVAETVPEVLRGLAEAGPDIEPSTEEVAGTPLHAVSAEGAGITADVAGWAGNGGRYAVALFVEQPGSAAEAARGFLTSSTG